MNKFVRLIVVLLVLAGAGYAVAWNYYAKQIQTQLEAELKEANEKKGFNLAVDSVQVKGFPFSYNITLTGVKAAMDSPELPAKLPDQQAAGKELKQTQVTLTEPVVIESPIFSKVNTIHVPLEWDMQLNYADGSEKYKFIYNSPAQVTLELTETPARFVVTTGSAYLFSNDRIKNYFHKLEIMDKGGKLVDEQNNALITYSGSLAAVEYNEIGSDDKNIVLRLYGDSINVGADYYEKLMKQRFSGQGKEFVEWLKQESDKSKDAFYKVDLSYTGPVQMDKLMAAQNASLKVTHLDFGNSMAGLTSSGEVTKIADDTMPVGTYDLAIRNYKELVSYYVHYFVMMSRSAQGVPQFTEEDGTKMEGIVDDMLTQIGKDENGQLKISIKREKGGEVYVSDKPISDVMAKIQDASAKLQQVKPNVSLTPPGAESNMPAVTVPPVDSVE